MCASCNCVKGSNRLANAIKVGQSKLKIDSGRLIHNAISNGNDGYIANALYVMTDDQLADVIFEYVERHK
jgi:hypothetical protein